MNKTANEELIRADRMISTRDSIRMEADHLFSNASKFRKASRAHLEKLFEQTPAAQSMSPAVVKTSAAKFAEETLELVEMEKRAAAPSVYSYFDNQGWLTEAQKRFPELQKVSSPRPVPALKATSLDAKSGKTPTRSNLAGGAP